MKPIFNRLLIATRNQGKFFEFQKVLTKYPVKVFPLQGLDVPEIEETGTTFLENAKIKAEFAAHFVDDETAVISDDSGICIDALGGAPGIYSSRYANGDFNYAMDKILGKLKTLDAKEKTAAFICELFLILPNGKRYSFHGEAHGAIATSKRGTGFGYDPIFIPNGFDKTFGEMSNDEKNKISHRGKALETFSNWMNRHFLS